MNDKQVEKIIFYKDTFINREIAFVLNIEYKFINKLDINLLGKNVLLLIDKKDIKKAESNMLIYCTDYFTFNDLCDYLDKFNRKWELKKRKNILYARTIEDVEKVDPEELALSEMLIKVLYSQPKNIDCNEIDRLANIDQFGNVWACCTRWLCKPLGNILLREDVYDNYYSRIIKLSEQNKTYCFCRLYNCKYCAHELLDNYEPELIFNKYPYLFTISIDNTCNLRCESCRSEYYVPTEKESKATEEITDKLIKSDILNQSLVMLAGQGEVFLSKNYEKILKSLKPAHQGNILSNGTLLTEEKWKMLYDKFETISLSISIDAASKETYSKLRHGNFTALMKNLSVVKDYKAQGKIVYFVVSFVVQRDNYKEMKDFVKLAKDLGADKIQFMKLNDWKCLPLDEYNDRSLIEDGHILKKDLYELLQDPIFKTEGVDISQFDKYMEESKKYYENE